MTTKAEAEREVEKIARKMARSAGHEGLWELYLIEAYETYFRLGGDDDDKA